MASHNLFTHLIHNANVVVKYRDNIPEAVAPCRPNLQPLTAYAAPSPEL